MPQTKSHIKNQKTIFRNRNNNRNYKLAIKKAIKQYVSCIEQKIQSSKEEDISLCKHSLSLVYKTIDKAVNKNVLHKNTAARKKSKLALLLK